MAPLVKSLDPKIRRRVQWRVSQSIITPYSDAPNPSSPLSPPAEIEKPALLMTGSLPYKSRMWMPMSAWYSFGGRGWSGRKPGGPFYRPWGSYRPYYRPWGYGLRPGWWGYGPLGRTILGRSVLGRLLQRCAVSDLWCLFCIRLHQFGNGRHRDSLHRLNWRPPISMDTPLSVAGGKAMEEQDRDRSITLASPF
jgi:hypothetical protein